MSSVEDLLERLSPRRQDAPDWANVLDRSQDRQTTARRRRATVAAVFVLLVAAFVIPGLGLGGQLLSLVPGRSTTPPPQLPDAADHRHVVAALDPRTGRLVLLAAPMKQVDGICFAFVANDGSSWGCARRNRRGFGVHRVDKPAGYTFDARATSAEIVLPARERRKVRFVHFAGRIRAAFFLAQRSLPGSRALLLLRDRHGTVIRRIPLAWR